jgi:diguanylate cyclase (GGDEF)-like protein/PAS domain S-box-containing protein
VSALVEAAARPHLRTASIVIVEDERIVALDLSQRLVEMGYRVLRTVARGEDALRAVDALSPDLVLMDINIEGAIDGIEAACRIRETSRTPVVFMTAYAEDETLARAQSSRPYGYLIKPYESRELHATIQVALARHDADAAVERSEERLRLAMDVAGLVVWDWDPRTDRGTFARPDAVPGDLSQLLSGFATADRESIRATLVRGQPVSGVWPVTDPQASREAGPEAGGRWMELNATPLAGTRLGELRGSVETGVSTRVVGLLRDVTARRHAEERLRQAGIVYERTADAIVMADARRRIVSVNPAFVALTGWTEAEALGRDTDTLLHDPPHPEGFWAALATAPDGHWRGEVGLRQRDGRLLVALQTASRVPEAEDDEVRYVLTCSDLTSIRRAQEQLNYLAHHDVLTGLPNRALLDERLDHELQRARRLGHGVALMFIDLDGFKTINDSLGHAAGDRLLQEVGRRLRASIRDADTAARLGGDEFVVVMTDLTQPEDASRLADKLLSLLAEPVDVGGRGVKGTASIGVAVFPQDGGDRGALMMAADSAMYAAKAGGRNHVAFYTRALARRARRRLDVEQGLRRSLERGELELHFQPIFALRDASLVAAEALLRWRREDGVSVAPQQFVPVAEDSGLIETIGVFVLERICEHARAWADAGLMPPRLCMNVSPRQLERGDFAGRLLRLLESSGLSPDRLEIEVTETALRAGAASLHQLDAIRALGVRIAIDDFGTGYSSLSALKHLPLDRLKIDRSFVHDLPDDTSALAIVETIVAMSRTLGLCVTAEGIETDAQLAALRRIGCEDGQGFLLGVPIDAHAFAERLRAAAVGPTRPVRPLRH